MSGLTENLVGKQRFLREEVGCLASMVLNLEFSPFSFPVASM